MFSVDKLTLHPKAHDCLFQHYRALRNIFHDVLGHLELDYLSIVLISPSQELIYFSSSPSLELNLIELNLWQHDPILCIDMLDEEIVVWNEIYQNTALFKLRHYKMEKSGICFGLSIPSRFKQFKVIYSFGMYQHEAKLEQELTKNIITLKAMGKFCLQNIFEVFSADEILEKPGEKKRHLYVIKSQSENI